MTFVSLSISVKPSYLRDLLDLWHFFDIFPYYYIILTPILKLFSTFTTNIFHHQLLTLTHGTFSSTVASLSRYAIFKILNTWGSLKSAGLGIKNPHTSNCFFTPSIIYFHHFQLCAPQKLDCRTTLW